MTRNPKNTVNVEAERNLHKLMNMNFGLKSVEDHRVALAWENENEIHIAAEQLELSLERIQRSVDEAKRHLEENLPDCLDSCGLFQSAVHDADTAVTKLHVLTKTRRLYKDLLEG
jgi:hypothetical protein